MTAHSSHNASTGRMPLPAWAPAMLAVLAVLSALLLAIPVRAEPPSAEDFESKLKTAYLVNIANFVTWPKSGGDIVLCASRNSHLARYLSTLNDIRLGTGRKLDVVIDPDTLARCDMLYWDDASARAGANALLETRHRSLLIVGDSAGENAGLCAIEFYVRNLKLRFFVNRAVVDKADYRISSKLMRLSRETE